MEYPLIELYRPKTWDEVLGCQYVQKFKDFVANPGTMPHILMVGPPGSGKTTSAKIIINELQPVDVLRINASESTGIETVREKIHSFVSGKSTTNKPRIVWCEEADFFSVNAWAALRSLLEQYSGNARFICTANYITKIPEPILSRFSIFEFQKASIEDLIKKATEVCEKEGIKYTNEQLEILSKAALGDYRGVLNVLQQSTKEKTLSLNTRSGINNTVTKAIELIEAKKWSVLRTEIPKQFPDYVQLLIELDEYFFNKDISVAQKSKINEAIANSLYKMNFTFSKEIEFMSCASIIMGVL